jgi:hypothetical protein
LASVGEVDVTLTPEQTQWQAAVADLAASRGVTNPSTIVLDDDRAWSEVVGMGVPSLRSPELSGVEATSVESVLAVEQVARHLAPVPVLGQAVVAPELLAAAGAADLSAAVADGSMRIAPALTLDLLALAEVGRDATAIDAAGASHALLLDGSRLALVELTGEEATGLDLTRRHRPVHAAAGIEHVGEIATDRLRSAIALALTAFAADLLGVMSGALADAVSYAGDRRQFGVPIGSFQAVQHILADGAVAVEGARGCVWHAAWAADHLEPDEALLAARSAKAYCSEAGRRVVESTVQVFGGIAITWEHLSHVRLRRVLLDRRCLGDEDVHHRLIAGTRIAAQAPSSESGTGGGATWGG